MNRKIFFFLDRLQLKRSERFAISILMTTAMLLSSLLFWTAPGVYNSEEIYADLDRVFEERSMVQQAETENILARYQPETSSKEASNLEHVKPVVVNNDTTAKAIEAEILININSANAAELQRLPGIGPAYSKRIVDWRQENGSFTKKEQLLEIKGIGSARFDQIKDLIKL